MIVIGFISIGSDQWWPHPPMLSRSLQGQTGRLQRGRGRHMFRFAIFVYSIGRLNFAPFIDFFKNKFYIWKMARRCETTAAWSRSTHGRPQFTSQSAFARRARPWPAGLSRLVFISCRCFFFFFFYGGGQLKENDVEDEEEEGTTKLPFTHLHYSTTSLFCFFVLFSSDDYLDSTIKGLKEKKIKFLIFFFGSNS